MHYFLIFNDSVVPMITIIAIAFLYNAIFKPNIREISSLSLNVFAPIMVFYSVISENITLLKLQKPFIFMILLTLSLLIIAYIIAKVFNLKDDVKLSFILSSSMINVGNFGLPLIYFSYGEKSIIYSAVYFVIFNIPLITIAIYLTSNQKSVYNSMKDIFKIPIFYAFIAAILFSQFNISLPESLMNGLKLMNDGAIALLVFVLGMQLSVIKFKFTFIKIIFVVIFIRLILSPLLSYSFLGLLGVSGLERSVSVVQTATPSALLPLIYMIRFNRESDLLATIILATTIVSGFTIPLVITLLK